MSSAILLLLMTSASSPAVHGHRGARAVLPENTIPALQHALEAGADYLEFDLGVTKDDHLVLLHDQEIAPSRCTRIDGSRLPERLPVRELTLREVKALDCGRLGHPRFPKQQRLESARIPTFDEVLTWLNASPHPRARLVQLNVETKSVPGRPQHSPTPTAFARLFVDAVVKHKLVERTVIQSFDHRVLIEAAKLAPKLRRSALIAESRPDLVAVAKAARAQIVSPNHEWITTDDVRAMHAAGLQVHPWTANTEAEWERLVGMKVDGIITDDPAALIAYLKKRPSR